MLVALFAGGAVALAASASRDPARHCGPASGHTLAADAVARVYVIGDVVSGCASGGKRAYTLGHRRTCIASARVAPVALAGRVAAYGSERCGVDTGSTDVVVRRLTDGVQLHALPATRPPGAESFQHVDSLVVKADGAVAWIATGSSIVGHRSLIEVHKSDRDGNALLDSGAAIALRSLRLHHSTLSWTDGSATRTAALH
jgi:hypothetical protein